MNLVVDPVLVEESTNQLRIDIGKSKISDRVAEIFCWSTDWLRLDGYWTLLAIIGGLADSARSVPD